MNHREVGKYWEGNAETWTKLARAGYDVYRDAVNTPGFMAMLPDVTGLTGIDLGCGEGHNTRLVAKRGARMTGIDISPTFVRHAAEAEAREPLGIDYLEASAVELPFEAARFDFATAFMSFMDIPEIDRVLAEAHRVVKPGGFLQFSILHPCFMTTPHRYNLKDDNGRTFAIEIGGYFERVSGKIDQWLFSTMSKGMQSAHRPFKVPRFTMTMSEWINHVVAAGFVVEKLGEPRPSDATVARVPAVQDSQVVAYFLHVRARRPVA